MERQSGFGPTEGPASEAAASQGEVLRAARVQAGKRLIDIADELGYSKAHLSLVERDIHQPSRKLVYGYERVLHIEPGSLWRGPPAYPWSVGESGADITAGAHAPLYRDVEPLIERYIKEQNLSALRGERGETLITFPYNDALGMELSAWLLAHDHSMYTVRVTSSRRIPRDAWEGTYRTLNDWHQEHHFPTAYLYKTSDTASTAAIQLEGRLPLGAGAVWELFRAFTDAVIGAGPAFWTWAGDRGL